MNVYDKDGNFIGIACPNATGEPGEPGTFTRYVPELPKTATEKQKRSCENCGNRICATSLVAIRYDECVRTGYQKHWRPLTEPAKGDEKT